MGEMPRGVQWPHHTLHLQGQEGEGHGAKFQGGGGGGQAAMERGLEKYLSCSFCVSRCSRRACTERPRSWSITSTLDAVRPRMGHNPAAPLPHRGGRGPNTDQPLSRCSAQRRVIP